MSETTVSALIVLGALAFAAFYARQSTERSRVRYMGRAMADLLAKEAEMHTRRVIARAVSVLAIAITGAIVAPHGARLVQSFRQDLVANQGPGTVITRASDIAVGSIKVETSEQGGLALSDNPVYVDATAAYPNLPIDGTMDSIWTMYGTNGDRSDLSAAGWGGGDPDKCVGGSTKGFFTKPTTDVPAANPFGRDSVMEAHHCQSQAFPASSGTWGAGTIKVGGFSGYNWSNINPAVESHMCRLYFSIYIYEPTSSENHAGKFFYLSNNNRDNATYTGTRWSYGGIAFTTQGTSPKITYNGSSSAFTGLRDQWYHVEWLFEFESPPLGSNTARVRAWVDGVSVQDQQNIHFQFDVSPSSSQYGWTGMNWYDYGTQRTTESAKDPAEHSAYYADIFIAGQPCSDAPWSQPEP